MRNEDLPLDHFREELEVRLKKTQERMERRAEKMRRRLEERDIPAVPPITPLPGIKKLNHDITLVPPVTRIPANIKKVPDIKPSPEAEQMMKRWEQRRLDESHLSVEELDAKRAEEFASAAELLAQGQQFYDITLVSSVYQRIADTTFYDMWQASIDPQNMDKARRAEESNIGLEQILQS